MEMGQILRLREPQNLYGLCLVLICFNHPFLEVPTFDPYIIIAHTEMSKPHGPMSLLDGPCLDAASPECLGWMSTVAKSWVKCDGSLV
jgi:hypothetical protein